MESVSKQRFWLRYVGTARVLMLGSCPLVLANVLSFPKFKLIELAKYSCSLCTLTQILAE